MQALPLLNWPASHLTLIEVSEDGFEIEKYVGSSIELFDKSCKALFLISFLLFVCASVSPSLLIAALVFELIVTQQYPMFILLSCCLNLTVFSLQLHYRSEE